MGEEGRVDIEFKKKKLVSLINYLKTTSKMRAKMNLQVFSSGHYLK